MPTTIGLVQQASSLGQFAGPASLGLWVEHFGWQAAPAILAPAALLGLASAFALRRILATAEHKAFYPHNLNRLLWSYPGATGLKTGLTDNAGGCMLGTATRDGRHLIAVVLNATLHSTDDAIVLLNYGFSVRTDSAFGALSRHSAA